MSEESKREARPPRILIASDRFPPFDRGGAERIAFYHARGLAKRGFDVGVFTSHEAAPGVRPETRDEDGIRVYRAFPLNPFTSSEDRTFFDKFIGFASTLRDPFMQRRLERAVEDFQPDLLHAHYIVRGSHGAFMRAAPALPRLITFHQYQYECPKGGLYRKRGEICASKPVPCRIYAAQMKRELSPASRIIAISRFIEQRLLGAGYPRDRVVYLPNGVPGLEMRDPTPVSGSHELLYVGRIAPNKGLRELVTAFRAIDMPEARLTIVGDGLHLPEIRETAAGDDRVSFEGWLGPQEVAERYRRCRAVVVPSLWHEVMCTVICEGQSWCRPVIATSVGGNDDLIDHGKSGFLCPPGDLAALTDAMARLLRDDELCEKMGRNGFEHVGRYGMERHLDSIEALYRELGIAAAD